MSQTPLPLWAQLLETPERLAAFSSAVERYFERRGRTPTMGDGFVAVGESGDDDNRYGLSTVLQMCLGAPEEDWSGLIAAHFDAAERVQERAQELGAVIGDFAKVAPLLRVRLFDEAALGTIADHVVTRRDIPGLLTVLMFDLPEGSQSVSRDAARKWNRPDQELFGIALEQVRAEVTAEPRLISSKDEDGAWCVEADSIYGSSMALLMDDLPDMVGAFGAYVAVPLRNLIITQPLHGGEQFKRIAGFSLFSARLDGDGPGSLSPRVWWYRDRTWTAMPYEITEESLRVNPPTEWLELVASMM